jgi:hypothetical protein
MSRDESGGKSEEQLAREAELSDGLMEVPESGTPHLDNAARTIVGLEHCGHKFEVEETTGGWETLYRLKHPASGLVTTWSSDQVGMYLEVHGAMFVCVSPYFTAANQFQMMEPMDAIKALCAGPRA